MESYFVAAFSLEIVVARRACWDSRRAVAVSMR